MKKAFLSFALVLVVFVLPKTVLASNFLDLNKVIFAQSAQKYFIFTDPEGSFGGPITQTATNLVVYWGGDPIPAGAFVSFDDDYTPLVYVRPAGSTGGQINIPLSKFSGPGNYSISIRYWTQDDILFNYTLPYAVSVY